jgi:hypothetical protein
MAAPNLKSPSSIIGKTEKYAPTILIGTALSNPSSSNKVLKVNSIFCANINGINSADISVSRYDGISDAYMAYLISVPAKATQIISSKETYFYLEEGHSIRAIASANSYLQLIISYEEIS